MNKNSLFLIFCLGIIGLFISGCAEEKTLELPFEKVDIKSIEISRYVNQEDSTNTTIDESSVVENIYDVFDGLKIEKGKDEEKSDKEAISFKFNLKDGKNYEIIYHSIAVKKGSLVISDNQDVYITSSDISGIANDICSLVNAKVETNTNEEIYDLIPMIMVNENLYVDTGEISIEGRCGNCDGIIDSTIGRKEIPSKNNQSNFGKYEYQYWENDEVHLYIENEWRIFKKIDRSELEKNRKNYELSNE